MARFVKKSDHLSADVPSRTSSSPSGIYSGHQTPHREISEGKDVFPSISTSPPIADKNERLAWYLYDWANGAFFYSAMNFLPLMITAQAREMAKGYYCDGNSTCLDVDFDWATNYWKDGICSNRAYDNDAMKCLSHNSTWNADLKNDAKYVNFAGSSIGYASFAPFCTTISVVIQLIIYVTMGSFADYGPNRKRMLTLFTLIGIVMMVVVFFIGANQYYWLNGVLWIVAIIAFNFATVFYNAFLPLLAQAHTRVIQLKNNGGSASELIELEKEITHAMSIKGLATGFSGQFIFLIGAFVIMAMVTDNGYLNSRISIGLGGVWIIVFTAYTYVYLKPRPGPPLPPGDSYCKHSVSAAYTTLKSFKHLKELRTFLIAYFIFSDGTSTIAQASVVFAQEELKMSTLDIAIALLEVSVFALLGCFLFKYLHDKWGVHTKTIVIVNLSLMAIVPIYAMISMRYKWEFYAAVFIFGINTGSQQAFTRSIYAHYLPKGREAEYFSFYQISDKGSAWLGPLVIAVVNQATGSYRNAFSCLVVFFVLGVFVLFFFKPDKAEIEKESFDKNQEESRESQSLHNSQRNSI